MNNKVSSFLTRATALALFAAPFCTVQAQEVYSATIGATAITVPASSDAMVALPFTQEKSAGGSVTAVDGAVVTLQGSTLTDGEFDSSFYLYVESGDLKGRHFNIESNTPSTISLETSDLAGLVGADVSVREHWTLGTLFPSGVGGVEEMEPGRPDVLVVLPTPTSIGGGIAVSRIFYFHNSAWREVGKPLSVSVNDTLVESGDSVVVRNNMSEDLDYFFFGEVEYGPMAIPLVSSDSSDVDNFVGVNRPLGMTIEELQLHASGAFDSAADRLLVYSLDAGKIGPAKTPTAYLYADGKWQIEGGDGSDQGSTVLKAGQGIAVRKAASSAATGYWVNEWSISEQ